MDIQRRRAGRGDAATAFLCYSAEVGRRRYHVAVGFDHVYLYDNTGSAGCHCVDAAGEAYEADCHSYDRNKYGFRVDAYGSGAFDEIAAKFPGKVTRVPWGPLDEHGQVTYGQNEALRDFVDRFGGDATWCCFTDLDEYVFSPSGRDLREDLDVLRGEGVGVFRLSQKKFRDRHDVAGLVTQCFDCLDVDFSTRGPTSSKQIVLMGLYRGLRNVHEIRTHGAERVADYGDWRFNHYNANASQLAWLRKHRLGDALDGYDGGMRRYAGVVDGISPLLPKRRGAGPAGPIVGHSKC